MPSTPPETKPSPFRRLPLLLALCTSLAAAGTLFGIMEVSAFNEPMGAPPLFPVSPPTEMQEVAALYEKLPELHVEVMRDHRAQRTALAAVNVISSVVLFLGCLLLRATGRRGLRILFAGLALSQAYAVLETGTSIWYHMDLLPKVRDLAAPLLAVKTTEMVRAQFLFAHGIAVGIHVLTSLAELAFYVYARSYFRRPAITGLFAERS